MLRLLLSLTILLTATIITWSSTQLSPKEAFGFHWHKNDHQYLIAWDVHPNYTLYLKSLKATENNKAVHIDWQTPMHLDHPRGIITPSKLKNTLVIHYQGCHKNGICLPPQQETLSTTHPFSYAWQAFLLGLLLSISPCLLPLWPIFIATMQQQKKPPLGLALAFIAGIVLSYNTLAFVLYTLKAPLLSWAQHPLVLISTILVLLYMALSMLEILPPSLRYTQQNALPHPQCTHNGYFMMGLLGFGGLLVLSPCLTPPLLAAIAYTPTLFLPASFLSLGMSMPFIMLALGQHSLMPYLRAIAPISQYLLGLFVVMIALLLAQRLIPGNFMAIAWCLHALLTLTIAYRKVTFLKQKTLLFLIPLLIAAQQCHENWCQSIWQNHLITNKKELAQALSQGKKQKKPTLIMVTASWCSTCKVVKKNLQQGLDQYAQQTWQHFDIDISYPGKTVDMALIEQYHLYAPPMVLWFDQQGHALSDQTTLGNKPQSVIQHTIAIIEQHSD